MRVHPLLLQLLKVLVEVLAWVGGAWRGREGQGLGSFESDLGLSTMLGILSAPEDTLCALTHSQNLKIFWLNRVVDMTFKCRHLATFGYTGCLAHCVAPKMAILRHSGDVSRLFKTLARAAIYALHNHAT